MTITSFSERNIVFNAVEEGDTLDDLFDFASEHVDTWGRGQVLWDMTLFDFPSLDSNSVRSLVNRGAPLSEKRSGLKTAILVDSVLGFGMMRMLQLLAEEQFKFHFGVFRNRDEAIEWLNG